ncbi:DUF5007 domain-containing protein [Pedobacter metabolipauper]|uniref:Uncharacterized protein DUF5007 n=1 Tax=Pedobacter metabolipauper TaxID=425513 RepID=A0A4R6SSB0_9SPHI|nr:DUF5007 domain-containing protein [Pedobacter metabolipauper]TDQ06633.1 uncharacterized protein DUF5007 [Pedobacter metabolipauper]
MKTKYSTYIILALIAIGAIACKKIENGFLSDTIRYKNNVIYCVKGMALSLSDRINADGSTPPFNFKMLNLRNRLTGAPAPKEFNTEYEILVFKTGMTFNPETDTTVALLNAKRESVIKVPMEFNPVSGQIAFNRSSGNLPIGEYVFDLEVSNTWGTKFYPEFAQIHIIEPNIEDVFEITYQANNASSDTEVFTAIKAPKLSCKKISNEGARVILKITDKTGKAFNPQNGEVIKRGDRPTFESHAKFNKVIATDTALVCDFEVAPFPLVKYITTTTDWGYLMYYRIPKAFVTIDGVPNNSVNPSFGFRVKMEGTYVVEVNLTDVTRK